jgi:formylglycine-generating enzyme required for sulfatase activity
MTRTLSYFFLALVIASCGNESSPPDASFDKMASLNIDSAVAAVKMDSIKVVYQGQLSTGDATLPDKIINTVDGSEQLKVPAGEFIYGINKKKREDQLKEMRSPAEEVFKDEFKETTISLPVFYIDKYEVTNEQFVKFLEASGYNLPTWPKETAMKDPQFPVTNIGWKDARVYAAWAGKRLPTEEEWEKAARGTDGRMWPWGNNPSGELYNGTAQGYFRPVKVGSYPEGASPYGVMDMAGNVYEMTTGKWNDGNAMRGGSFLNNGAYTRTMFRWSPNDTINGAVWLGFRCVMDSVEVVKSLKKGKE